MYPGHSSSEQFNDRFNDDEKDKLMKAGYEFVEGTLIPQPISRPQFTLTELRNAVPAHCFERSMVKSFGYLALDIVIITSLLYSTYFMLEQHSLPTFCQFFGYPIYWFIQGSFMFGIWVVGHECGHGAFSENNYVNDVVGLIAHSALLVPYHSWKISHRKHHSNTSNCENDEAFVPPTRDDVEPTWSETVEDSPLFQILKIILFLVLGWMPTYLIFNGSGPKKYRNGPKSHFNPNAALFTSKERPSVVLSDVGFTLALIAIGYFVYNFSFAIVLRLYIVPYFVMSSLLVLITLLQHTDTYIPHFRKGEWTWLTGALRTVDRSYGKFLDIVFHHLNDTHVCHHIFPKIPFYHSVEATEAIKPILGKYYMCDTTPIYSAFWRAMTHCKYVENDGDIVFYKKNLKIKQM